MTRKAVVLASGIDSELLIAELLRQGWTVHPLYVRCGFRWEAAELKHLRAALRGMREKRLRPLVELRGPLRPVKRGHWSVTRGRVPGARAAWASVYLPGRNVVLLGEAWMHAVACGAEAVAIGTLKGNPFPDATPRFRAAIAKALNLGWSADVRLLAPFSRLEKAEALARGRRFRLEHAFSCLAPRRGEPCGGCSKCAELTRARRAGGRRP